jgi:hypothetical protein
MNDDATDNMLKPCPHCGGVAQWESDGMGGHRVACQDCYAGEFLSDQPEALIAWEKRIASAEERGRKLEQEQRDVLSVWEWHKVHGGGRIESDGLVLIHPNRSIRRFNYLRNGSNWFHKAAEWVREQSTVENGDSNQ